MALRQMGIARMGPYRPPVDGVNAGGKTGRPKLLHNGVGHGLTGGGGLNAKGTGGGIKVNQAMRPLQRQLRKSKYQSNKHNAQKINERERAQKERAEKKTRTEGGPAMNPHPVGSFMWGDNQWGQINKSGQTIWNSKKPGAGGPIIGLNQALPWLKRTPAMMKIAQQQLQTRQVQPAVFHDPIYATNMANAKLERDNALSDISHQVTGIQQDYDYANQGIGQDFKENVGSANAELGASNMANSGTADATMTALKSALMNAQSRNQEQFSHANTGLEANRLQTSTGFDVTKTAQEGEARERWQATHQGQKLPGSKNGTIWNQDGITYRTNEHGIPQTWTQKPKPVKAAKPKFPGAKTYIGADGKPHKLKGVK